MSLSVLRLNIITAAALLPVYLRVGAFVPAVISTRCASKESVGSSSRWSAPARSTAAAASVEEAKNNLKRALVDSKGSTLAPDVVAAVEALGEMNPTSNPARAWSLLSGNWISIGEDFKDTTRTVDGVECTLGRLVFDIFEPVKMPVLITSIENNLGPRPENASPTDESSYEVITHFVARDGSGLRGITAIKGGIAEDPSDPNRLVVKFSAGSIEPDDGQDLDSWSNVIGVQDPTDTASKGPLRWIKRKVTSLMLKLVLGFRGPADELGSRGELSYEMRRSPSGALDVIFIDDDMRVTRGNKGAVTVVTRQ